MNILTLDTSTSFASVAITVDEKLAAESLFPADRSLSARLTPEIERLLDISALSIASIDLFAGAIGPGSFTGVRAGIATLQGLALATAKPCAGFSSLALIALNFPKAVHPVCSMLDARKSEVYAALFDCSSAIPATLINDCVMPPEAFLHTLRSACPGPVIFAGEGALRYRDIIASVIGERAIFASSAHNTGHAANGALLAGEARRAGRLLEPAQLLPVYIRASEAEYAKMNRQPSTLAKQSLALA